MNSEYETVKFFLLKLLKRGLITKDQYADKNLLTKVSLLTRNFCIKHKITFKIMIQNRSKFSRMRKVNSYPVEVLDKVFEGVVLHNSNK